jgi:response regulator RpfG family c-di-GMP phosphodiesterase
LADAIGAMEFVILERVFGGGYRLLSEPRDYLLALSRSATATGAELHLLGQSPFLDNFIVDAEEFWAQGRDGRLHSGTWEEVDEAGAFWPLEAQALLRVGHSYLVIEHLAEKHQENSVLLQSAREHLLSEEALEREVLRRTQTLRRREEEIAMRLLAAAGTRDGETGGHVRRIGLYAAAVGEALGWSAARTADIRVAAPMHDIGKIGIPDAILLKPGHLTHDEYQIMKQHTLIGAKMLAGSDIELVEMGREIALCHHEKWDGGGYPNGLSGEGIPITARIVSIVDVYDAMVNRRVYKEPIPEKEVLNSMTLAAGYDFDPKLLEVFLEILPTIRSIRDSMQD